MRSWHPLLVGLSLTLVCVGQGAAKEYFDPGGAGVLYPAAANGSQHQTPQLRAYRLLGEDIEVDGHLDDAAWQAAETAAGFTQFDPERGAAASEQTVFKVAYDERAIYFGVACYERDIANVMSNLSRRDNIENSDIISIYVDPYHDKTTGYNFRINMHGVQEDHYIFDDGNRDRDWNAVWLAETSSDAEGWYLEVRIPFSQVRYRPADSMTWGLQMYRFMYGRGEDTAWANWDRNAGGFVSRWGTLTNLVGVPAPRQLEIMPYVVQRSTDQAVSDSRDPLDQFQNIGADLKYGLTADLTLTATFQPDFGQVEADPALLNLSPFETFYEEKRPFFVEGARFFEHPKFNLFYSRRIGTGDDLSRIRFAAKLLGKTSNNFSIAALVAATDVAVEGQAYNPFKIGTNQSYYAVGRFGKEFGDGNHRINFMATTVQRDAVRTVENDDPASQRDAYSGGADCEFNFLDRSYSLQGSVVATLVDAPPVVDDAGVDHAQQKGTGGSLRFSKTAGTWRGAIGGSWEHDKLDPNDMGILFAPDEISSSLWVQKRYDADGEEGLFNRGQVNVNFYRSWLYAGRAFPDLTGSEPPLWSYAAGHPQGFGTNVNTFWQTKGFWGLFAGIWHDFEGTSKYNTRDFDGVRGPLMTTPEATGYWVGFDTDWRKRLSFNSELEQWWNPVGSRGYEIEAGVRWVQSSQVNHRLSFEYRDSYSNAQWLDNFANLGGGIGDVSYVFGGLQRYTWDLTLRSNVLFSRNQSLEIYLQPFLTVGDYSNARELLTPDSYDLQPYSANDFAISDRDFTFGAVNLNLVYRWEYRPGSTLFLVWTHSREQYQERGDMSFPDAFHTRFDGAHLFSNEPENRFLVKLTYWFSI